MRSKESGVLWNTKSTHLARTQNVLGTYLLRCCMADGADAVDWSERTCTAAE